MPAERGQRQGGGNIDGKPSHSHAFARLCSRCAGIGAVAITEELVLSELSAASGKECTAVDNQTPPPPAEGTRGFDPQHCSINATEYANAFLAIRRRFSPRRQVKTHACIGSPGFMYLAGCVTAGM